jgi:hypothetical protein
MTPSTASFSSFELVDSHVKLVPVETLCVKESATASSESAKVVRPTTSNPVLATLWGKESASPTWQETASQWWDLQLAVAEECTHLERVALRQSSTSPLPIPLLTDLPQPTWQTSPPTWTQMITELPGWVSPPVPASPSPAPQIAQCTGPIRGEKKRFSPRIKSGGKQPRTPWCKKCKTVGHTAKECAFAEGELELPLLMKKAQELPQLTLLEKVELMRKAEWTPEVCHRCWKHNAGHKEVDCPAYERCLVCQGTGGYGYLTRHVCKIWPSDEDVFMDEDYEYWSRYE